MTVQLKLARQALVDLETVVLQIHKERIRRLPALGLSLPQAQVIRILGEHAPLSLTALSALLATETPPSRLVSGLVDQGLVNRQRVEAADDDRRQVVLALTRKGKNRFVAIQKSETALARWLAKRLSQRSATGIAGTRRILDPTE